MAGGRDARVELHQRVAAAITGRVQLPCRFAFRVHVGETREPRHPAPTLEEYTEGIADWVELHTRGATSHSPDLGIIGTWNTGHGWLVTVTPRLRPPEKWNEPVVENANPPIAYYT